jgi:hypothetical protein
MVRFATHYTYMAGCAGSHFRSLFLSLRPTGTISGHSAKTSRLSRIRIWLAFSLSSIGRLEGA